MPLTGLAATPNAAVATRAEAVTIAPLSNEKSLLTPCPVATRIPLGVNARPSGTNVRSVDPVTRLVGPSRKRTAPLAAAATAIVPLTGLTATAPGKDASGTVATTLLVPVSMTESVLPLEFET